MTPKMSPRVEREIARACDVHVVGELQPRLHHIDVDDFSTATVSRKSSSHSVSVLQPIGKIPTHRRWRVPFVLVQVIFSERCGRENEN